MRNTQIYDLPTRIFHWIFASLFVVAFFIAKNVDDESPIFSYHMFAGLMLGFIVSLRLLWGVIGTKYARFSSFALHPSDLAYYIKGVLIGSKKKWPGHNPASSWAAIIMFALAIALGITGLLMTSGDKEIYEDVHEILANAFLITVLLHIAGVILHAFRHQDAIILSMIDGKKQNDMDTNSIKTTSPIFATIFILLIMIFGIYLFKNYSAQNGTLNLFGTKFLLSESENEDHNDHD